ncbi:MAG: RusA family crossover junction endodeoxyribonuclease [Rhizobacter sp.]
MISFTVPGQPQGKGRPRIGKAGRYSRMFTPEKTVAYEGLVSLAAQEAMAGKPPLQGPCQVVIGLFCQVPASWSKKKREQALAGDVLPTTKPDADNCVKAIFDGMNGVVWRDDVQAVDLKVSKRYAVTPGVVVGVEERSNG